MHQMVSRVYSQVSRKTASEHVNELAVFEQITGELEAIAQADRPNPAAWGDAITRNMQLWTIVSADLMKPENALPEETRQGLMQLGLFVLTHSQKVLAGDEEMDVLIDINRSIIEGLKKMPTREAA